MIVLSTPGMSGGTVPARVIRQDHPDGPGILGVLDLHCVAAVTTHDESDVSLDRLDESGRPSFNMLQNYGSSKSPIQYYVFDVLVLGVGT